MSGNYGSNYVTPSASLNRAPFDVWITPYALEKLNQYATAAQPNEIGGLARLQMSGNDVFVIDVDMMPQTVTAAHFDIDSKVIADWTRKMFKAGKVDELSEWASIVHSHPIGMSPSMSGPDLDAIKRYASEEDAFSLIITASNDASSRRMSMNYCTNVRGQKLVIRDIPVRVAHTIKRSQLVTDLVGFLTERLGSLSQNDTDLVRAAAAELAHEGIPGVLEHERIELRKKAEADVKEFVKQERMFNPPAGYLTTGMTPGRGYVQQQRPTTHVQQQRDNGYEDWWMGQADIAKEEAKRRDHEELVCLANGWNSDGTPASKNAMKKAKRRLEKLRERAEARRQREEAAAYFEVGDEVLVREDAITTTLVSQVVDDHNLNELMSMTVVEHKVDKIDEHGIHVNGYVFNGDELLDGSVEDQQDAITTDEEMVI